LTRLWQGMICDPTKPFGLSHISDKLISEASLFFYKKN